MAADQITITFPDGSTRTYESGATGYDIAASIAAGLARQALAVRVNGKVWDLTRPIEEDATIEILTWDDPGGRMTFWHSSAHLLAEALEALYPGVKFGIGPPIDQGFYYDVDLGDRKLGKDDLERIEAKMKDLAKRDVEFDRKPVSKSEALEYFEAKGDEYKLELIEDLEDGTITFYRQGNFTDLCRGPHLPSTGIIKYPKLLNLAGAYWRGDERRAQLTRIYGVSFPKKSMLDEHLE
ncbi:MAG: TGS domain-containing protein, partial [Rhodothermales bacterium]